MCSTSCSSVVCYLNYKTVFNHLCCLWYSLTSINVTFLTRLFSFFFFLACDILWQVLTLRCETVFNHYFACGIIWLVLTLRSWQDCFQSLFCLWYSLTSINVTFLARLFSIIIFFLWYYLTSINVTFLARLFSIICFACDILLQVLTRVDKCTFL